MKLNVIANINESVNYGISFNLEDPRLDKIEKKYYGMESIDVCTTRDPIKYLESKGYLKIPNCLITLKYHRGIKLGRFIPWREEDNGIPCNECLFEGYIKYSGGSPECLRATCSIDDRLFGDQYCASTIEVNNLSLFESSMIRRSNNILNIEVKYEK